jgi:spermidine synthase
MNILVSEEAGVRYLHFSSNWIQGAMRIARPWALELDYTREMMACLLLRPDPGWPRRALLIGLGAGSLAKFLYRYRPKTRITVIEIEPAVVSAAQLHFKLPQDESRLHILIADGADFVTATNRHFDLIMVDGYDAAGGTGRLESLPFFHDCKARLSERGMLVSNLLSRRKGYRRALANLDQAFSGRCLVLPPAGAGNVVAFAAAGSEIATSLAQLRAGARALKADTGVNLLPSLGSLEAAKTCPGGQIVL